MTYLTAKHIIATAAKDPRIDPNIELDEPGKALVWLADGYTWDKRDGNRTLEGFIIAAKNVDQQCRDTLAHWKDSVSSIERINPEA